MWQFVDLWLGESKLFLMINILPIRDPQTATDINWIIRINLMIFPFVKAISDHLETNCLYKDQYWHWIRINIGSFKSLDDQHFSNKRSTNCHTYELLIKFSIIGLTIISHFLFISIIHWLKFCWFHFYCINPLLF